MDPIEIIVTQADITPTTSTKSLNQISQSSTKLKETQPKQNSKNSSTKRSKQRERQPLLTKAYTIDEDNIQTSTSSTKYDSDTESKRSLSPSAYSMRKIMLTSPTNNSQNRTNLPSNERYLSLFSLLLFHFTIFFCSVICLLIKNSCFLLMPYS